jgi:hypothetical protein
MVRAILCGVVSLALIAGCRQGSTSTQQKMRARGARGTVEKVEPATGSLTIKVRSRQNAEGVERTFQVVDDTTITSYVGEAKKELKGKAGLRDPQFKQGSRVSVTAGEDDSTAQSIQVGDLPRGGKNRGGRGGRGAPQ